MKKDKYPSNFKFQRICKDCKSLIIYKNLIQYEDAIKNNRKCRKCGSGWSRGLTKNTSMSLLTMSKKVSKTMKNQFANGKIIVWNKGLTKDTSTILKENGKKRKGIKHSKNAINKITQASIEHWKNINYRKLVSIGIKKSKTPEKIKLWQQKMERLGYFTPIELKSEWEQYQQLVNYYTRKNNLELLTNSEYRGRVDLNKDAYHLDHIYSTINGFIHEVLPEIIGSIYNLRFIPAKENVEKNTKNHITLKELKRLYYGSQKS